MQHDEITTIIKKSNDTNMPSMISFAHRSGSRAISLTCLLMLVPVLAYGAGLGRINVKSGLGEPLNADIELLETSAKEAATLVARIGNNDEYLTAGLQDAIVPPGVRVASVTRPDGTHVLHVTTPRAVNEPFLELLIKVDSDNLHLVRQYTVLLDPPTSKMGDEPAVINAIPELKSQGLVADVPPPFQAKSKTRKSRSGGNVASAASAALIPKPTTQVSGETYLTQPGDIFGKVAQQYQPAGVPLKKVMAAFYAANPEAFRDGDINQLKAGEVLKIPSPEALGGTLPNKAQPAVVEVPPPAAPKPADAPPNPEFVLKISPGDASDAADKDSQSGEPVAEGGADGNGASPQATPTPEPVAPAPAAAQPAAPVPSLATVANQAQPGFWETVLDRLVWIGLGLLLGLVSLGMVYFLHMRRLTAMQKWHEGMVQTTTRLHPNDVEPNVVSTPVAMPVQATDSANMAPAFAKVVADERPEASIPVASSESDSTQEADFDIHEVDPIMEAEIYISYGRDEQAENILLNALEKTPNRHELTLCLLKIYAERRDAIAFDNLALRLQKAAENAEPGTMEQWHSAAVMGHRLSPHNPVYVIEGITDQVPAPEPEEDTLMLPELEPVVEEPPELPEFEPLKPLAETNILEFTFEKIPAEDIAKKSAKTEEHDIHAPLFPAEKK
jgi:pilus assembly protein FimV